MKIFTKKQQRSRRSNSKMKKSYSAPSSKSRIVSPNSYTNSDMFTRKTGLFSKRGQ